MKLRLTALLGLCVSFTLASVSQATFVLPSGWARGDATATYQEWDVFTTPPGPGGPFTPDIGVSNAAGAPTLVETSYPASASLITGSGNIYSFAAPTSFEINVPNFNLGAGYATTVVLQTRIIGTQIDPASVLIDGVAPTVVETLADPAAGSVETLWRWDSLPGNDASYTVALSASGSSMSFGAASVDTFAAAVPEPATWVLGLAGIAALAMVRRRARG
jgi:hypothetical protein